MLNYASRQRKIGVVLSYVNIVLQAIVNFIYVPLLLYYIGKSEYGLYQLMGSMIAYFSIMDFGLSAMVIRFYTRYRTLGDSEGMENILAIAQRAYAGIVLVMLLIGGGLYPFLRTIFGSSMNPAELDEAEWIYIFLLANLAVTLLSMTYRSVINAHQRYLFLRGLSTVQIIMQPLVIIIVLQECPYALSVVIVQSIVNMLASAVQVWYSYKKLNIKIKYHYWNKALLTEVGHFSLALFVIAIVDQFFFKTNQVILGIISGTAAVAVYAVAANIQNVYMMLSVSVTGVFLPHVTEMVTKGADASELSRLFIRIGRIQFFILALIGIGFILFGKEFIILWAGADFVDAYYIALLIMLPFVTDLIQNIGFTILQAMNRYHIRAVVYSIVGIMNLLLAIPLGIKYGGIGCAMATGLCMFLGNGIGMSYCYKHYLNLHMAEFWQQILSILLRLVLFILLPGYFLNSWLVMYVNGGIALMVKCMLFTVAYIAFTYLFCFNSQEKILLADFSNRFMKKCK